VFGGRRGIDRCLEGCFAWGLFPDSQCGHKEGKIRLSMRAGLHRADFSYPIMRMSKGLRVRENRRVNAREQVTVRKGSLRGE